MKHFFPILPLVLLAACASGPGATPDVTCASEAECAAKWTAAEMWITHRARRPIRQKTDDFMESEHAPVGNALYVQVRKVPLERDLWGIEVDMRCGKRVGCDPSPWEAIQSFKRSVNKAWIVPSGSGEGSN